MNTRTLYMGVFLFVLVLLGCSSSEHAGGTSTTENYIQVRLISDSLQQPTSARVRIFDESSWYQTVQAGTDPVISSTQVDRSGLFSYPADSNCIVFFVNDLGEMALVRCRDLKLSGADFVLSSARSVQGIVQQNDSAFGATKAWIEGSDLSVEVKNGAYRFESVPKGNQRVVLQPANHTEDLIAVTALPAEGDVVDTIPLFGSRVVLDDFEDGNAQGLMKRYFPSGAYWWQSVNGSAVLTPKVDRNADFINPSRGWRGAGLDVEMSASGTDHAIIGLDLGTSKTSTVAKGEYSLTKMHSIHFMAKGSGSVDVQLSTAMLNNESIGGFFSYKVTLTDQWTRYDIFPTDLQPIPSTASLFPDYTWADAADRVRSIEFVTMGGAVHLQLDELILEGISPRELAGL